MRKQRILRLGDWYQLGVGQPSLLQVLQATNPLLLAIYDEVAGNLIDYGSEGADGVVTGPVTRGAAGVGDYGAYAFNGVSGRVTLSNASVPNVKAATTFRTGFIVNFTNSGESNNGHVMSWGGGSGSGLTFIGCSGTNNFIVRVDLVTTNAQLLTAGGQRADMDGQFCWLFVDYDDSIKTIRAWKYVPTVGVLTAFPGSVPGSGAFVVPAVDLVFGNASNDGRTTNGSIALHYYNTGLWDVPTMEGIIDATPF